MLLFSISRPVVKIFSWRSTSFWCFCFMALEKFLSYKSAQNCGTDLNQYSKAALKDFIKFYEIPFDEISNEFGKITKEDAIELIEAYYDTLPEDLDSERLHKIATSKKVEPKVEKIESIAEVKTVAPSLPTDKKNFAREGFSKGNEKAQFGVGFALGMIGGIIATPYFLLKG
jgi:hypothetical protein